MCTIHSINNFILFEICFIIYLWIILHKTHPLKGLTIFTVETEVEICVLKFSKGNFICVLYLDNCTETQLLNKLVRDF